MSLSLPPNFENDIQGKDTALFPMVVIGDWIGGNFEGSPTSDNTHAANWANNSYHISTNSFSHSTPVGGFLHADYNYSSNTLPILLNIPSLKESIDIEKRNYKISSVNIDINNFPYNGERFSDLIGGTSLINTEVRIFWWSPSTEFILAVDKHTTSQTTPDARLALQIFYGTIRRYTHDDEKVRLVVEDRSQATLHKPLPLEGNYLTGDDVPDKYKNKPIPMVYGHVDRSPCVISYQEPTLDDKQTSFKIHIDSQPIGSVNYDQPIGMANTPYTGFLYISDGEQYFRVVKNYYSGLFAGSHSWSKAQIDDIDITLPIINMTAHYKNSLDPNNSLAANLLELDYSNIPNSASPTLIGLSETNPGNYGDDTGVTIGEQDENNLDLIEDQNLKYIYDMDSSTFAEIPKHWSASTNDANDYNGMGFTLSFPSMSLSVKEFKTHLQAKFWWETMPTVISPEEGSAYTVAAELRFKVYTDASEPILYYTSSVPAGDATQWEHLEIDNLFGNTQAGYTPSNNFNHFDFPITWYEHRLDSYSNLGNPISFYQLSSLDTNDTRWGLKLYGAALYHNILVDKPIKRDYYANVNGRVMDGDDSPTSPTIIEDILKTELDPNINIPTLPTEYSTWKYAFTVDKKIDSKKLIENIASASPFIPRFDNMGNFRFDVIPKGGVTVTSEDHHIKEADVIDFSFSRSKIEQVYTKIVFKYNWDYAREEFNDSVVAEVDYFEELSGYKLDYYGLADSYTDPVTLEEIHPDSTLTIDDDRGKYIRNHDTAQDFANWFLMWSCNQHLKIKVKLPLKYMNLGIGDMVKFDAILGGVKPYGIDYHQLSGVDGDKVNGQTIFKNFLITSTNKTLEWVEIECIQMHNLDADIKYGCMDQFACNYEPLAVEDSGCQYNDCAGVCGGDAPIDCCGDCQGSAGVNCGNECYECGEEPMVQDECGICGGSGIPDGECDCNGNVEDCAGVCGGDGTHDYCGDCNGNDATCSHCATSNKINYTANSTLSSECKDPIVPLLCPSSDIGGAPTYNFICDDPEYGVACEGGTPGNNVFIQPNSEAVPWALMHDYCIDENGQTRARCTDNTDYSQYPILLKEGASDCDTDIPEWSGYDDVRLQTAYDNNFNNLVSGGNISLIDAEYINLNSGTSIYMKQRFRIKITMGVPANALAAAVETHIRLTYFSDWDPDGVIFRNFSQVDTISHVSPNINLDTFGNDLLGDTSWWQFYEDDEDWVWKVELITVVTSDGMALDDYNWEGSDTITFILPRGESGFASGDINGDGRWDVLDIVALSNCVLGGNCVDLEYPDAADMSGDGEYNVLDIVTLANCVLAGNCGG